jgi:CHAT domain-containing protein
LWNVGDAASRHLLTAFHRSFARSGNPIAALREAQLEFLRGADVGRHDAAYWGAFIVVSGVKSPASSMGRLPGGDVASLAPSPRR